MLPVKGYTKICLGILFAIASFVGCISKKSSTKREKVCGFIKSLKIWKCSSL